MKKTKSLLVLISLCLAVILTLAGCTAPQPQPTEPESYTVVFNPNGGTLVSGELVQTVTKGAAAVAPVVTNGSQILSWSTDFSNIQAITFVTAIWSNPEYTVTFDLNGGTLVSGSLTQAVPAGSAAIAPVVTNGTQILSWDTDFSDIQMDTVVKALWDKPQYTVTFDLNGGTLSSGNLTQTVTEGCSAIAPIVTNGTQQLSWSVDFSNIQKDTTVTALWDKPQYTVTFHLNGGTLISGSLSQTVAEGGSATAPVVTNGTQVLSWDTDFSDIQGNTTVIAVWSKPQYTVTFDLNGGTLVSGELSQTVKEGEAAVAPIVSNGNLQASWSVDFSKVTSNITVQATWEKVPLDPVALANLLQRSTVKLMITTSTGTSYGSGFFIDDKGTFVTCFHVIDNAVEIKIKTDDGAEYTINRIVAFNPVYDIAILSANRSTDFYLNICQNEDDVQILDTVYATGSPLGLDGASVTKGTISYTSRMLGLRECFQTTASISGGNSGGPLVNEYGEAIGIVASHLTRNGEGNDINLAIKMSMLAQIGETVNYSINQFIEWQDETGRNSYHITAYMDAEIYHFESKINAYQIITGVACAKSYLIDSEGNQVDAVNGFDQRYSLFLYEYDPTNYKKYTEYLNSQGFDFWQYDPDKTDKTVYYYNAYYDNNAPVIVQLTIDDINNMLYIRVYYII